MAALPRQRSRELAGDQRAGVYPRAKARTLQYEYARRNWGRLLLFGVVMFAMFVAFSLIVHGSFQRGFIVGFGVAAVAALIATTVVYDTGTASIMRGGDGEQFTAQALRGLRRSGWRLINHVKLRQWDTDHVLVGQAGVFAVETRWSATPWVVSPPDQRVLAAVRRAAGNARDFTLWSDLRKVGVERVAPVVFLWGAGTSALPPSTVIDQVTVVSGPHARSWSSGLGSEVLSVDKVDRVWSVLDERCRRTDPLEKADQPMPPSIQEIVIRVLGMAGAFSSSFVACSYTLGSGLPIGVRLGGYLVILLAGALLTRIRLTRAYGWSWVLGGASLLAIVGIDLLVKSLPWTG